jgi:hypothetical protein
MVALEQHQLFLALLSPMLVVGVEAHSKLRQTNKEAAAQAAAVVLD